MGEEREGGRKKQGRRYVGNFTKYERRRRDFFGAEKLTAIRKTNNSELPFILHASTIELVCLRRIGTENFRPKFSLARIRFS